MGLRVWDLLIKRNKIPLGLWEKVIDGKTIQVRQVGCTNLYGVTRHLHWLLLQFAGVVRHFRSPSVCTYESHDYPGPDKGGTRRISQQLQKQER